MIYADYNGSAPLLPCVKEYLKKRIDSDLYANPNAIHSMGQKIHSGIEKCRDVIAHAVGCYPDQIIFNSGSSEGISQILFSCLEYAPSTKKMIVTSSIEHAVIPSALKYYEERRGFKIEKVHVNQNGLIDLDSLKKILSQHQSSIALVTIMAANNETGVIQPINEISKLCQEHGILFFSDTTQVIGKGTFHFNEMGLDFAVCSGHKVGALSGSGFVIAKDPTLLKPYIFGSHQEKGLRGGTQHYLGIETLAIALDDFIKNEKRLKQLLEARQEFESKLKNQLPLTHIIGGNALRLPGTSLISYPGIHGQAIQIELESNNIFVTTSAACSDNQPETSHVLKAMGIGDEVGRGVIRLSLSHHQQMADYHEILCALVSAIKKLEKIKSF
jgi:cysteine desulfurase